MYKTFKEYFSKSQENLTEAIKLGEGVTPEVKTYVIKFFETLEKFKIADGAMIREINKMYEDAVVVKLDATKVNFLNFGIKLDTLKKDFVIREFYLERGMLFLEMEIPKELQVQK